jgi:hypothetical protein
MEDSVALHHGAESIPWKHIRIITVSRAPLKPTLLDPRFTEEIHLRAQVDSVIHSFAFGPNAEQPVGRLKTQTALWSAGQSFKANSTECVAAGGYLVHTDKMKR